MTKSRGIHAPRNPWTEEQIAILKARYADEKTEEIAADVGHSLNQTYQKALGMGLRKSPAYLASPAACRLRRGDNVGSVSRFKKGMRAWNAGMIGLQMGGEETQFKSGHAPHNTKPVGSYRISRDGSLQRKVGNDKGSNSKRWRGVHELVWIERNGPVPTKHIVVFKPGMKTIELEEITIDRVECISLADNMKRNTRHNLPKPLADLIALRAAVTRQINKRSNNHEQ